MKQGMTIEIRSASPSDATQLTSIAWAAKAHWGYPETWLKVWAEDLQLTPEYLGSHRAYVAEIEGEVAGMAVLEDRGSHWQIEHVWVQPTKHGRGVGKRLVTHCLTIAFKIQHRPVHVLSDPNAEAFYLRLGAVPIGTVAAPMPNAPDRRLPLLAFNNSTVSAQATALEQNKQVIRRWLAFADRGFGRFS